MKVPHKQGVEAVRYGLLNMSEQEETVGADFLAHVFWGVLDDSCRHFSNPLSPEAARTRYMDPESVRLPGTRLGNIAEKLAFNEPLINLSVPRQWLVRGATAAAGYQSVGPIRKTKVDGNLLRDICRMCPKSKPSTVITRFSCQRMR